MKGRASLRKNDPCKLDSTYNQRHIDSCEYWCDYCGCTYDKFWEKEGSLKCPSCGMHGIYDLSMEKKPDPWKEVTEENSQEPEKLCEICEHPEGEHYTKNGHCYCRKCGICF